MKLHLFFRLVISTFFIVVCCAQGFAQELTLLKSAKGYVFLFNRDSLHFTIEFAGLKLQPLESEKIIFNLDGKVLQIQTVENKEFLKTTKGQTLTNADVLEHHRKWESEFLGDLLKSPITSVVEKTESSPNREILIWSFKMPKKLDQDVREQVFLTTQIGENILVLNYAVTKDEVKAAAIAYLTQVLSTLKTSDKAIDVKTVQEDLRKN